MQPRQHRYYHHADAMEMDWTHHALGTRQHLQYRPPLNTREDTQASAAEDCDSGSEDLSLHMQVHSESGLGDRSSAPSTYIPGWSMSMSE